MWTAVAFVASFGLPLALFRDHALSDPKAIIPVIGAMLLITLIGGLLIALTFRLLRALVRCWGRADSS